MADYGIKITLPGYDISTIPNTAANKKKFSLLSSLNLIKVKTTAKVTLDHATSVTVAHGLAYIPIFWCFLKDGTDMVPVYYDTSSTQAYIDSTNLEIYNSEGGSRDFYYYIFHDSI